MVTLFLHLVPTFQNDNVENSDSLVYAGKQFDRQTPPTPSLYRTHTNKIKTEELIGSLEFLCVTFAVSSTSSIYFAAATNVSCGCLDVSPLFRS